MYGSLMDSSDIEIEQFSSGWFLSLSLVQTTYRPLPLIGQVLTTNQRGWNHFKRIPRSHIIKMMDQNMEMIVSVLKIQIIPWNISSMSLSILSTILPVSLKLTKLGIHWLQWSLQWLTPIISDSLFSRRDQVCQRLTVDRLWVVCPCVNPCWKSLNRLSDILTCWQLNSSLFPMMIHLRNTSKLIFWEDINHHRIRNTLISTIKITQKKKFKVLNYLNLKMKRSIFIRQNFKFRAFWLAQWPAHERHHFSVNLKSENRVQMN